MPPRVFKRRRETSRLPMKKISTHRDVLKSLDRLFGVSPEMIQRMPYTLWAYGRQKRG